MEENENSPCANVCVLVGADKKRKYVEAAAA